MGRPECRSIPEVCVLWIQKRTLSQSEPWCCDNWFHVWTWMATECHTIPYCWVCLWACSGGDEHLKEWTQESRMCSSSRWASFHSSRTWREWKRGGKNLAVYSCLAAELGHLISSSPALRLGFPPSATWFMGLQTQDFRMNYAPGFLQFTDNNRSYYETSQTL